MMLRLITYSVVLNAIILIVTWISLSTMFLRQSDATFAEEREEHFSELMNLVRLDNSGQLSIRRQLSDPRFLVDHSGYYWQVENGKGEVLRSPSLGIESLKLSISESSKDLTITRVVAGPSGELVMLEQELEHPSTSQWLRVGIGTDKQHIASLSANFDRISAIAMTILGLGLLAATFGLGIIGYRPLINLNKALSDTKRGDTNRISASFPTELDAVVSSINELIEANEAHLHRSRVQAGNLAHALKTPLAISLDLACQLHNERPSDETEGVIRQGERMREIIDYHIARIRSAAIGGVVVSSTPVGPSLRNVSKALSQIHPEKNFMIRSDADKIFVRCDQEDFEEIIANLYDNAGKWASKNIDVYVKLKEERVCILIEDDGPGMNDECIERAFSFGERLDERQPGSGLGLTIVRDLVEGYGGRISLSRSRLGGLSAKVVLQPFNA